MKKKYEKHLTSQELMNLDDSAIDYSDIPELDEAFWTKATLTPPKTKPNISLRLPDDVVAFFKAENPKGYTKRMASILTAYVLSRQSNNAQQND
jgi:uncharacterized protein (DUF4415 family)